VGGARPWPPGSPKSGPAKKPEGPSYTAPAFLGTFNQGEH